MALLSPDDSKINHQFLVILFYMVGVSDTESRVSLGRKLGFHVVGKQKFAKHDLSDEPNFSFALPVVVISNL
ncbi:hypothetical protein HMPREF0645_1528 [Hallella bergensis DSM 17361]|uniref:Uncharacterized protein n=1 Tax=Hallella bergensis DSM 17361 TaxID=585502 RepID=D1PX43_9BACT|nr:hypothetical protein HMPREF0645_1528 [Hallella bergensis DSM 17361]